MENYGYQQAINSRFLVLRFEMHASQIQGCVVEQRVEKKRKIAEFVWVHNVVTVRTGKVAGQCAMPYTPYDICKNLVRCAKTMGIEWR